MISFLALSLMSFAVCRVHVADKHQEQTSPYRPLRLPQAVHVPAWQRYSNAYPCSKHILLSSRLTEPLQCSRRRLHAIRQSRLLCTRK